MAEILNEYKREEGIFLKIFKEFSKVVDGGEIYFSLKGTLVKEYIKIKKVSLKMPCLECQAEVYEVFEDNIQCVKGDYKINLQNLIYQNWGLFESSEEDFLLVKNAYRKAFVDKDSYKRNCKFLFNKRETAWENINKIIKEYNSNNNKDNFSSECSSSYVKYDFDTLAKIVNLHPVGKYVKIISDIDTVFYGKFDSIHDLELVYISNMVFDNGVFFPGSQHRFIKTIKSIIIISEKEYFDKLNEIVELYKI